MGRPATCDCGTCKKCKARVKARERYQNMTVEERRAWVARRDQEKVRARDRARQKGRQAYVKQVVKTWRQDHPERMKAHNAVARAKAKRILVPGPCARADETCNGVIHAHHEDYSKPLEVEWLCARHHGELRRIDSAHKMS